MKVSALLTGLVSFTFALTAAEPASAPAKAPKNVSKLPAPTHANVAYGPHARNVLDMWLAKSDQPTPVLVHIHGGGWINGDKNSLSPAVLQTMLDRGVSVAAINYRYSTIAPLPAPVHDAARAIQFLRSKAGEWKLNKERFAAMGGSAGACSSLWLNYHDDLANPSSDDPVARESTRLSVAVGLSGQTAIDPKVIVDWVGDQVMNHAMISRAVGAANREEAMARYDEFKELYREFSAYNHVDKSDPPVLLVYGKVAPLPAADAGTAIHHAAFGEKLKEKAEANGAQVILQVGGPKEPGAKTPTDFLLQHLLK